MAIKIQMRRDTAAQWTSVDPILAEGEWGYETDTGRVKIGDGVTAWTSLGYKFEFAVPDHGSLSGLGDDDHPQYLNETRHDALPNDNPHNVDKIQVGLANVPNVDATDRANHTGAQLSNTISDFQAAVEAIDANSGLSLAANILTYTKADGSTETVDLSLYLDDTNLARIVNGTLNPATGILTVTRDDSSTFDIDLSALLDDQNASEVPVTPTGNLASSDVQAALEEHQSDIDNINTEQGTQNTNIANNSSAIATIQSEQATQNNRLTTNEGNISSLQASQATQDAAIALNTAKVSADGSITTHSDTYDTPGLPVQDDVLSWNNTTQKWEPKSFGNEFTIFCVWAEENGNLSNNNTQWSFGNGSVGNIGIPLALDCQLFALSFNADSFGTSSSINVRRNGATVQIPNFTTNNQVQLFGSIPFSLGDVLSFETNTVVGTMTDVRVCAWFRVPSSALFPTPDRSVVNNTGINFSSTAWTNIPGMSTTVTISDTGTVDGIFYYSGHRAGATNSEAEFRVVIGGVNGATFLETLSTFNDNGVAAFYREALPPGTYTVVAQAQVTQPIVIEACQLNAVGVES